MKTFVAGKYRQHRGYRSFTPAFVNSHFVWEAPRITLQIEQTARLLGELNAYAVLVPDVDFSIPMSVAKEAANSNRIEGTKTELDEVVLPREEINPERRDDWHEVQNYIAAMHFAISKLSELPLSMRLLREAHKILLSGVRGEHRAPGEIRRSQNWIGGSSPSDAFFVPPSAEEVPELLSDLEKFWHNQSLQIPTLIKIAITHYQFETIHPFLDGNGRGGRLLIILQLIDARMLDKPVLYMSAFFEKHRSSYYDSLSAVRELNDLEQWITFFLTGIAETARHGIKTFKAVLLLRQAYDEKISKLSARPAKNAQKLLRLMYAKPIVSVSAIVEALEMSFSSANRLLKSLTELGVLQEITGFSRNRLFVLEEYLALFRN